MMPHPEPPKPDSTSEPEPTGGQGWNSTAVLRIIDAAANRAGEGLRVVEDYVRFALDNSQLTEDAKRLRHDLTAAIAAIPALARHRARATSEDVGRVISTAAERTRSDAQGVATAAFKRLEQSLRSLEEYGKTASAPWAAGIEQLRYRVYTLEKLVGIADAGREALAEARLYVLVDGCATEQDFASLVDQLVRGGVNVIQLRDKDLPDRELVERARILRRQTRGTRTLAIINDRPDIAALSDADGVHVGQDELTVKDVRTIVGPKQLVGVSTHSVEQAQQAVSDGADYIGVGPTFPSETKQFPEHPGLRLVADVAAAVQIPAFAIGGITLDNVLQVRVAGLDRVAVSAAITRAANPELAAQQMLERLNS